MFHIKLLMFALIWNFSFSQNFINYTEKDGLASNFVYRMRQDHDGFMWFITDKGISKFDGSTFKNFTVKDGLPANDIWNIRITPDNRIWYFTRNDALGYIKNDSVYSFKSSDNSMMNPNGRIFQSGNDISFVRLSNIYRFSDSMWQHSKYYERKIQLLNRDEYLVFDTLKNSWLEDKHGQHLLTLRKSPEPHHNEYQFNDSLLVKVNNDYYEIINLNSLSATYGDLSQLKRRKPPNDFFWFNLANDKLQVVGCDWLISFNDQFKEKETYHIPPQLNSTHNFQDRDGFIWAATSENGVYKLPIGYEKISAFFEKERISKVVEIDNSVYVAIQGRGVYKITDGRPKLHLKDPNLVYTIQKINNSIFYVYSNKLTIENSRKYRTTTRNKKRPFGRKIVSYRGNLFSEGYSNIKRLNNSFGKEKEYDKYTNYQGLFVQNDTLFTFSFQKMLHYNAVEDGFSEYKNEKIQKKLLTTSAFNNHTYLGTEGDGLYVFDEGKLNKLINNDREIINAISIENENSIWSLSEGVLLRYNRNETGGFSLQKYDQINGYPTNYLTDILFYNSQLFLGSTKGLIIIDVEDIGNTVNFTPYVKGVTVNGKKFPSDSLRFDYSRDLSLKVNFGAVNFFDSDNTTFKYKLNPVQNAWTTTSSGEVNLFDLQPDTYQLRLKVEHNGTNQVLEIPITIAPKWWQTYWLVVFSFVIGLILLFSFLFFILKRFRKKLQREKYLAELQLRALRSQMNPHFVHNSLNAIQYYIQRNEVELSENYLASFSKLIRLFFEYSRRQNILIEEEILLLDNYLQIEKLRFEDKLNYTISVDELLDVENQIIPSMILQPIVENAVNHGLFHKKEKGNITIDFKYISPSSFQVNIKDDGIGILKAKQIYANSSKNYESRSSKVLEERLELLNQNNSWDITQTTKEVSSSEENVGTLVSLIFNQYLGS